MTKNDSYKKSKNHKNLEEDLGEDSPSSNSSRDTSESQIREILAGYAGLELLPEPMQKRSYEIIQTKLQQDRIKEAPNDYIFRMRKEEIFKPFRKLSTCLLKFPDKEWLRDTFDFIVMKPFTVKTLLDEELYENKQMEECNKKRIQRLKDKLENIGILESERTGSELDGIPYNRKLFYVRYYWIPNYHTRRDIEKHVFSKYRKIAYGLGRPEDQIPPKSPIEIAKKRAMQNNLSKVVRMSLAQTPLGKEIDKAEVLYKSKKELDKKKYKKRILRSKPPEQDSMLEKTLREVGKGFLSQESKELVITIFNEPKLLPELSITDLQELKNERKKEQEEEERDYNIQVWKEHVIKLKKHPKKNRELIERLESRIFEFRGSLDD
ncbi:MAG: hypothetical protein ACXABG_02750 [Promethearchaeota archaeon]|jgi:hypothetical protein